MSSVLEVSNHVAGSSVEECSVEPNLKFYVEFRRHHLYSGEHGFDWMRPGHKYTSLDYKALKSEYTKSTKEPRPECNLKPTEVEGSEYFVPWLSFFPKQEILLTVRITFLKGTVKEGDLINIVDDANTINFSAESESDKNIHETQQENKSAVFNLCKLLPKINHKDIIKAQKENKEEIKDLEKNINLLKQNVVEEKKELTNKKQQLKELENLGSNNKATEEGIENLKSEIRSLVSRIQNEKNRLDEEIINKLKKEAVKGVRKEIVFKVSCKKPLNNHSLITVYDKKKNSVGYLKVLKNSNHENFKFDITPIRILRSRTNKINEHGKPLLVKDNISAQDEKTIDDKVFGGFDSDGKLQALENYLSNESMNQALLHCSFRVPSETSTPESGNTGTPEEIKKEESSSKKTMPRIFNITIDEARWIKDKKIVTEKGSLVFDNCNTDDFRKVLSEQHPQINKKRGVFLFLAPLKYKKDEEIGAYANMHVIDARTCVIFETNLGNSSTFSHEIAHVLGLEHTFLEKKYNNIKQRENSINEDSKVVKTFEEINAEIERLKSEKAKCEFPDTSEIKKYAALEKEKDDLFSKYEKEGPLSDEDNARYKKISDEMSEMNPIFELTKELECQEKFWKDEEQRTLDDTGYDSATIHRRNYYEGWNPHKFLIGSTENIMNYDNNRFSFYKFQWLAIQDDVKKFYNKK